MMPEPIQGSDPAPLILGFSVGNYTNDSTHFFAIGSGGNLSTTESARQNVVSKTRAFAVTRIEVNPPASAKSADTTVAFRAAGANAIAVTIPAGSTLRRENALATPVVVPADTLCCFMVDTSNSTGTGALQILSCILEGYWL
jgi:hypothetical protein